MSKSKKSTPKYVSDIVRLESLHDRMNELVTNANTLHQSYESIVRSMVKMQKLDRSSRRGPNVNSLLPTSTLKVDPNMRPPIDPSLKDIEPFLSADTREQAFQYLFQRITALRDDMNPFMECFDEHGMFNDHSYMQNPLTETEVKQWTTELQTLTKVVDRLLEKYNNDLLDLYRLTSSTHQMK